MTQSHLRRLGIREQTATALSMCEAEHEKVEEWLGTLPSANIGETTKQLYRIIAELQLLQTPADNRLAILDVLAPKIENNISSLARHYQHKRAILPPKAQKVVDLSHALNMCVANNYIISGLELAASLAGKGNLLRRSNKLQATNAIFGALRTLKQDLLLSYRLFSSPPATVWLKIHQLFAVSLDLNIHTQPVWSETGEASTIEDTYAEVLMLGSIKANQLRQDDLVKTAALIPGWVRQVSIDRYQAGEIPALFIVNRNIDRGPVFSHLINAEALTSFQLQFSTTELVQHLRQLVDEAEGLKVLIDGKTIGVDLLNHLILAWGKCTKRSFMRIEAKDELEICVGLGVVHKFAAGDEDLESMVHKAAVALTRQSVFGNVETVAEESANDEGEPPAFVPSGEVEDIQYEGLDVGATQKSNDKAEDSELIAKVTVNNSSPGGYSLSLPGDHDVRVHAGDMVGVKDVDSEMWSVGAVRWLHRSSATEVTFGVELLSPAFVPSIVRVITEEGALDNYIPVLMLPEISVTGQSPSLLVTEPIVQLGQTLQLLDRDRVKVVNLTDEVAKTRSYMQFAYSDVVAVNDADDVDQSQEEFDEGIWQSL